MGIALDARDSDFKILWTNRLHSPFLRLVKFSLDPSKLAGKAGTLGAAGTAISGYSAAVRLCILRQRRLPHFLRR